MTNKSMRLRFEHLRVVEPITKNQQKAFKAYKSGMNLVLSGSAGSGKTFVAMALALEEVMDKSTPYNKVVIIRSAVPTRDMGFLPGTQDEKELAYHSPYVDIVSELFDDGEAWQKLAVQDNIHFLTTSYIRGVTLRDAIIIIDEMQNLTFHELDSVITRVGENCRFMMCGDYYQSDFHKDGDRKGILKFLDIMDHMKMFEHIEFTWEDIVRSGLVRDYIMTKEMLENNNG